LGGTGEMGCSGAPGKGARRIACAFEVLLIQMPARLGSRQALSKGRRQAWGAMS
jgi:hypothetical protein